MSKIAWICCAVVLVGAIGLISGAVERGPAPAPPDGLETAPSLASVEAPPRVKLFAPSRFSAPPAPRLELSASNAALGFLYATVRDAKVTLRGAPRSDSQVVAVLAPGERIAVLKDEEGWIYAFDVTRGAVGWARSAPIASLAEPKPKKPPTRRSAKKTAPVAEPVIEPPPVEAAPEPQLDEWRCPCR